jgi:hypothetical protein
MKRRRDSDDDNESGHLRKKKLIGIIDLTEDGDEGAA